MDLRRDRKRIKILQRESPSIRNAVQRGARPGLFRKHLPSPGQRLAGRGAGQIDRIASRSNATHHGALTTAAVLPDSFYLESSGHRIPGLCHPFLEE